MKEEHILTGPLEPTNEPYAVAKIAGLKLVEAYRSQYGVDFISCIPANSFGPGDDFISNKSHVVGALIQRMREAGEMGKDRVVVWGTGSPRRDFLYVEDIADACVFLLENYSAIQPINIGSGNGISIKELALMIQEISGFEGTLDFDLSKPDGMPVKILDATKISEMGWTPKRSFKDALKKTYHWLVDQKKS